MLQVPDKDAGDPWGKCTNGRWGRGCHKTPWLPSHSYRANENSAYPCLLSPPLELAASPSAPEDLGGLWRSFRCSALPTDYSTMQAVQATMILSTTLCCVAFLVFVVQLFRLKQGERFVLTSIIQLMSCK